jgi:hypothetical protein
MTVGSRANLFREAVDEVVESRKHLLVKHSTNENTAWLRAIKDDMAALLDPIQSGVNSGTGSAHTGHGRQVLEAALELREIQESLIGSPEVKCVVGNVVEVAFRFV